MKRIFLDADGVLVNLDSQTMKLLGCNPTPEFQTTLRSKNYLDTFLPDKKVKVYELMRHAGYSFWEGAPLLPWAKGLVDVIQKIPDVEVFICTSPGSFDCAPSGKIRYFKHHFPDLDLVITKRKFLCANYNSLLIDDTKHQVNDFMKYGGHGYLFPPQQLLLDSEAHLDLTIKEILNSIQRIY